MQRSAADERALLFARAATGNLAALVAVGGAIRAFLDRRRVGLRGVRLHEAFGFARTDRAVLLQVRDALLREARRHCPSARALADAARRFEAKAWPLWSSLDEPPHHCSDLERALWQARCIAPLPTSERMMRKICRQQTSKTVPLNLAPERPVRTFSTVNASEGAALWTPSIDSSTSSSSRAPASAATNATERSKAIR